MDTNEYRNSFNKCNLANLGFCIRINTEYANVRHRNMNDSCTNTYFLYTYIHAK